MSSHITFLREKSPMPRETGRTGYKVKLIEKLERMFPGALIYGNDPLRSHQGIPDLTILYNDRWAMLEVKASLTAKRQPNQPHWVAHYNELSFAAFICPENETEVLNALQAALTSSRAACNTER